MMIFSFGDFKSVIYRPSLLPVSGANKMLTKNKDIILDMY